MTDNKEIDAELDLLRAMVIGSDEEDQTNEEAQTSVTPDYIAYAGVPKPECEVTASKEDIIEALKTVMDPEIMINIYDMGLIYNIDIRENADAYIDMTVTTPACPVAGILPQQAADAVALVEGVGKIEVKIVWEPAWTPDLMTDDAKMMFELF